MTTPSNVVAPPGTPNNGVPWSTAFSRGFAAPWRGFVYLWEHPGLWIYGIVPVLLNLVITAFVLAILVGAAIAFVIYFHPKFPEGWWGILIEIATALGLLVAAGTLAFVVWMLMLGILVGHSLGLLAKQVELQLGTPPDQLRDIPWRYQILDSFRDVAMLLAINGGTLLLHVIPLIGSVLAVIVSLYFDSLLFGAEVFDYPLMLRGMRREEKWKFLNTHRPNTLGLGFATMLVAIIPLIGPIFMTTATVGAVLLYHELEPTSASAAR
jgi:CysZ protein